MLTVQRKVLALGGNVGLRARGSSREERKESPEDVELEHAAIARASKAENVPSAAETGPGRFVKELKLRTSLCRACRAVVKYLLRRVMSDQQSIASHTYSFTEWHSRSEEGSIYTVPDTAHVALHNS